jgi:ATP-binding cassette subfamily B protein/subfamily B ATP-binding cassette protein MsbA
MGHGMQRIVSTEDENPKNRGKVITRLIGYLRPYWVPVLGAFILIIINAGTQAAGPYLIGRAVDGFITAGDKTGLGFTMLTLAGVYLAGMISMRYQIYLTSFTGQKVLADMRIQIFARVEMLSLQYLERKEAGDLMSRLVNDIDAINSFFSQGLTQLIGSLFALIGVMIAMFTVQWQLALGALAIVPFMFITTGQFSRMARRAFRKTRETIGDVSADLQEELDGVKVAQAFNREDLNIRRFAERNAANRDANVSANAVTSAFAPAMDVLSTLDTAIVAGYGGYLAVQGVITVGVVVAFIQYVQNFFRPIATFAQLWTVAQSAFAASERVFELIDTEPDILDDPRALELPVLGGEVQFENVTFGYDLSRPVLRNINFSAQPGMTVAIVGPTGAGKSTLVNLIQRFYEVTKGRVLLDNHDVREVTQKSLRSQMGVVLQEPFLFSGTVLDNIRYGRIGATDEEVYDAAKAANAHDFIARMPESYQTEVGERGGMLSQGQRQLISIARAILADPRILILDEATASVDTRTEALIQAALNNLLKGRTSFVIAHRLSTVRNADVILALDDGQIVERGTHDELVANKGLYAELYDRQFYIPPDEKKEEISNAIF